MEIEQMLNIDDLVKIYRAKSKTAFYQRLQSERETPPEMRTIPDPIAWHRRPLLWRPVDIRDAINGSGVRVDGKKVR